jgi:hypothetical protein
MCDASRIACGYLTEEMTDNPLREIVRLNFVLNHQLACCRSQIPMTANHALEHSLMSEMIHAFSFSITLSGRIYECEIPRSPILQKTFLQRSCERLRMSATDKSPCGDCNAVSNH